MIIEFDHIPPICLYIIWGYMYIWGSLGCLWLSYRMLYVLYFTTLCFFLSVTLSADFCLLSFMSHSSSKYWLLSSFIFLFVYNGGSTSSGNGPPYNRGALFVRPIPCPLKNNSKFLSSGICRAITSSLCS